MALVDTSKQYDNLGALTGSGISAASFVEIRDALLRRMLEIYGADIELSSASADGQYINSIALLISNMYRLLEGFSNNLNITSAGGAFLDNLCALSNVRRKSASYSTAQIYVKNITNTTYNKKIEILDRANKKWQSAGIETIEPNEVVSIVVTCEEIGQVTAPGTGSEPDLSNFGTDQNGWINTPVDFGKIQVYQSSDAIVGNTTETDSALRSRRYNVLGGNAITTQAALEAALYNLEAIKDVYIINNNTEEAITSIDDRQDTTSVASHNVYICLRYKDGINISEDVIGDIIYKQLTPGVHTEKPGTVSDDPTGGIATSYSTILDSGVSFTTWWKRCTPISPEITVSFNITSGYAKGENGEYSVQENEIIKAIKNYASELKLNENFLCANLQASMMAADLKPNGISTFFTTSATIGSESAVYNLTPWTYYDYSNATFTFTYSGSICTLTISTEV